MIGNLSRFTWYVATIAWGIAAVGVWKWTTGYEFTTHAAADRYSVQHWPSDSSLALAKDRPTMLFFMHPRCPCTRASIHELDRLLTGSGLSAPQQPKLLVVASLPPEAAAEWHDTVTVRSASALPRAEMSWDVGGRETSRFGVVTSGAVRLYDLDGGLLFTGGVTASRGHEGDNVGTESLWSLLSQRATTRLEGTPVFGCRLCVDETPPDCGKACEIRSTGSDGDSR